MLKIEQKRIEDNIFDRLMCRESGSFTRSIHGPKGKKIRREAHIQSRRAMKILRRINRNG